ncbi:MAG: serine/threonine-protein kinase, partial [Myxococcota bacterium]
MSEERTFGPYTLLHPPLGAGGMAITYKARERLELGGERIVVVKQILPRWAADKRFRQMFLDEARLSSLLNHNNICRIYKGGRIGDTLFLAMEFVDGTDLLTLIQRLRKRGLEPLPLAHALYIIEQVLQGLEAAHAATDTDGEFLNLVHRDVSPHNVLIGSRGDVKLIDFGVAKSRSNMSRTADGAVKGKVAYASPEQILRLALDRRSDLFAAGLLLYKLTTGIHPLAGTDQLQTFSRFHRYTKGTITIPPPSHQSSTALPQRLDDVVMRALAIDREERYQTADAMALAVGDLLRELFPRYRPKTFRSFTAWALESSAGAYIPAPETLPNLTLDVWTSDDTAVWDPLPTDKPPQRAAPLLEHDDPVWNIDTSEPPTLLRGSAPWDEIKRAATAPNTNAGTQEKPKEKAAAPADNSKEKADSDDEIYQYGWERAEVLAMERRKPEQAAAVLEQLTKGVARGNPDVNNRLLEFYEAAEMRRQLIA